MSSRCQGRRRVQAIVYSVTCYLCKPIPTSETVFTRDGDGSSANENRRCPFISASICMLPLLFSVLPKPERTHRGERILVLGQDG